MEQQNQQPIQEKTENKPPVKTNWKSIAVVVVFSFVIGGIVIWLVAIGVNMDLFDTRGELRKKVQKSFPIQAEERSCTTDVDCVRVGTDCSGCSCGAAINKTYQQEFEDRYAGICNNYRDPVCEFYCETPHARCINNRCVLSAEPAVADTFTWQTYRNDEFGFEVRYPSELIQISDDTFRTYSDEERKFWIQLWISSSTYGGENQSTKEEIRETLELLRNTGNGEKIRGNSNLLKVKNTTLDECIAPQYFYSTDQIYVTSCARDDYFFEIVLSAARTEDLEVYRYLYDQILSTFRFVDSTGAKVDVLIPEEVLAKSEEFDGKEIQIKGVLTWIPFVDSFGLGGASPGFQTKNGTITVGGIQPAYDAAKNKNKVIVRGIYDAKNRLLKFSDINCKDCVQVIPSQWDWELLGCGSSAPCSYKVCSLTDLANCYSCVGKYDPVSRGEKTPASTTDPGTTTDFTCELEK